MEHSKLDSSIPNHAPSDGVRLSSWGIFHVAHQSHSRRLKSSMPTKYNLIDAASYVWRFARDLYRVSPKNFIFCAFAIVWAGMFPAISLLLCYFILNIMQRLMFIQAQNDPDFYLLQVLAIGWLIISCISNVALRFVNEQLLILDGHLRAQFMPSIVAASLRLGMEYELDFSSRATLPGPLAFTEPSPGSDLLNDLAKRCQNVIAVSFQLGVMFYILSLMRDVEAKILASVVILHFSVLMLAPTNGVGGAGYTFWTDNAAYHRLSGLYSIVFSPVYRETLVKDGISAYISQEYKRVSGELGPVKTNILSLACHLPPPWYWALVRGLVVDHPMTLYVVIFVWCPSPSIAITIAFSQYAITVLRESFDSMRGTMDPTTIRDTLHKARCFYEVLSFDSSTECGTGKYPHEASSPAGIRISLRDLTVRHTDGSGLGTNVVDKVSAEISPGQLVVIVGESGSGKSSLVKALTKLVCATSGSIQIDGEDIGSYDADQLRQAIAFFKQSDEIYPVSLEENILVGLPDQGRNQEANRQLVDEAARLSGAHKLIQRLGHERVINPPGIMSLSLQGCGNGHIGEGAVAELDSRAAHRKEVKISDADKQRVVAARIFMRLVNADTRLLIVDDPTPTWDSVAERELLERFLDLRKGITTILVNQRFGSIAHRADVILCMESGKIAERGTHTDLMHNNGHYAKLYRAQTNVVA